MDRLARIQAAAMKRPSTTAAKKKTGEGSLVPSPQSEEQAPIQVLEVGSPEESTNPAPPTSSPPTEVRRKAREDPSEGRLQGRKRPRTKEVDPAEHVSLARRKELLARAPSAAAPPSPPPSAPVGSQVLRTEVLHHLRAP